jgi:hypothetical protein
MLRDSRRSDKTRRVVRTDLEMAVANEFAIPTDEEFAEFKERLWAFRESLPKPLQRMADAMVGACADAAAADVEGYALGGLWTAFQAGITQGIENAKAKSTSTPTSGGGSEPADDAPWAATYWRGPVHPL